MPSLTTMRFPLIATLVVSAASVAGCATSNPAAPTGRTLGESEAAAFEQTLRAKPRQAVTEPAPLFVQPLNKTEPCKLPTTKEQLERSHLRTFWDGQCKNGYAFGLGRDIAISDTHHVEEITVHDGTSTDSGKNPTVDYDFVNNRAAYRVPTGKYPAATLYTEQVSDTPSGFFMAQTIGAMDESGDSVALQTSPLRTERVILNRTGNVLYRFTDNMAMPGSDPSIVKFSAQIVDAMTGAVGGVAVVRYGNGYIRHVKYNGSATEWVVLPTDYATAFLQKANAIYTVVPLAQANLERARQMEREYLYLACNGNHTIDGLDATEATRICTWRSQFQPRLDAAVAVFSKQMEQLRTNAELATQQHIAQQQAQQQYTQQQAQAFVGALADMGQQIRAAGQQSLNSVTPATPAAQAPNFTPFGAKPSTKVLCMQNGAYIACRD